METVILSRWQFGLTTIYHFFFVPLTLGLSVLVAIMETLYVRSGNEVYKKMTKFFGRLFLINFAMGTVTGIVQEFQFGMNWADYSRFVGDIFGAPLAIDGLLGFFLELTFLGIWIFGWEKLSKKMHAATIWLVAIGANLSAFFILAANSFMQSPVGYTLEGNRAVMVNFFDLIKNPYLWMQFPHTVLSGFTTGAVFVGCISVYHLLKKTDDPLFKRSLRLTSIFGLISIIMVIGVGHAQAQGMFKYQPMKIAAAEGLWETENPASLSLFTIFDEENQQNDVDIRIPYALSLLAFNRPSGEVVGIKALQSLAEQKYGPGDYTPNIPMLYWSFRIMIGAGFAMLFGAVYLAFLSWRKNTIIDTPFVKFLPLGIFLPYFANTTGWILTEMGRQPWVVYGLMKTENGVSPVVGFGPVLFSLITYVVVYGILMAADVYLLMKYVKAGPSDEATSLPDAVI